MMITLILALAATSAAETVSCPLILPAEALTVRAPPGWYGSAPTFLRLQGGAVMRGHPDKEGYLVPSRTNKIKGGSVQTFIFDVGEERWLWCAYGNGSPQLSRKLSAAATECVVTVRETRQDGVTETTALCR